MMQTTINPVKSSTDHSQQMTAYLWGLFAICFMSNYMGGAVSTLMSVYLPTVVNSLKGNENPDSILKISSYINAIYILGWALGGLTWGVISDRIGRSKSLALAVGSFGLFTLSTSFAPFWELVVILRLLAGFGVGGVMVIATTLLTEVLPERSKAIFIGILSIGFPVGIFSSGLVNLLFTDWREGFMTGIFPCFLAVFSIFYIQESKGWNEVSKKANKGKLELLQTHKSQLIYGSIIFGSMVIGLWAMFSWIPTWVHSLLSGSAGQSERGISMMILGAGGVTGGFFSGWIVRILGVRKSLLMCFTGCIIMTPLLFLGNSSFSTLIYIEIAILALFFGISQGLLSAYIPPLFHTSIRASATGVCFNLGRFLTVPAVFFLGALVTVLGGYGNALMAFSGVFAIGFFTIYFIKEKPLAIHVRHEVELQTIPSLKLKN